MLAAAFLVFLSPALLVELVGPRWCFADVQDMQPNSEVYGEPTRTLGSTMPWFTLLAFLCLVPPCFATSYAEPRRRDVFSPNKAFVIDVDPKTEIHTVYDAADRKSPLWCFRHPVWHFPFLLSNDGKIVVTVAWKHVQEDDIPHAEGVAFWNVDRQFKVYSLKELCPDPPRTQDITVGPIGEFWRTWYMKVDQEATAFSLQTTTGIEYRFRLSDGAIIETRRIAHPEPWDKERPLVPPHTGVDQRLLGIISMTLGALIALFVVVKAIMSSLRPAQPAANKDSSKS